MDISLSPDNERFLQNQIAAGIYKTISEAINANLSIIISAERSIPQHILQQFKEDVQKGLDDVENANLSDGLAFINELIENDRNNAN